MALAALLVVAVPMVAACGSDSTGDTVGDPGAGDPGSGPPSSPDADPSGTPPLSSTPPPTLRPASKPPKTPSDQQPDWIAGRVTRGGSGPCYGLETDDGTRYAMYSADGFTLDEGSVVRVRVAPLLLRIYCGPGQHVRIVELETVG